ncbi:MAG: hypothetical protein ABSA92_05830 [Candidatus Bathyarchaeia archaeon]
MPYVLFMVETYSVKATFLLILLGLMFVTSTLVGIAYATPTVQPAQSSGGPYYCPLNPPYYYSYYYSPYYYWNGPCFPGDHAGPRNGPHGS